MKNKRPRTRYSQDFKNAVVDSFQLILQEDWKKIPRDKLDDLYALYLMGVNDGEIRAQEAIAKLGHRATWPKQHGGAEKWIEK